MRSYGWAIVIRRRGDAATCPWEVLERLPDGRERLVGAYQTLAEASAAVPS